MKVKVDNASELLRIIDKSIDSVNNKIEENNRIRKLMIDEEYRKELKSFRSKFFPVKRENVIEYLYRDMGHPIWNTVHINNNLKLQLNDLTTLKARILYSRKFGENVSIELDGTEVSLLREANCELD